jgi:hypothetical protein
MLLCWFPDVVAPSPTQAGRSGVAAYLRGVDPRPSHIEWPPSQSRRRHCSQVLREVKRCSALPMLFPAPMQSAPDSIEVAVPQALPREVRSVW